LRLFKHRCAVGRLPDDDHVRLAVDEQSQPLTHNGVVIDDKDAEALWHRQAR
jgi:hypothetical protein